MQKIIFAALRSALLFVWLLALTGQAEAAPLPGNPASPSDLLALVNQLRAANGLPAYKANSALMGAAQSHSDYQAATGNTSHTGKGGSRPRDRAVAWGYGGGAAVYVSENIATGTNMSAEQAVSIWQGDSLHLGTMLSTNYRDAGVGVAEADGVVYYTLDVGYVAGDQGSPPSAPPSQGNKPGSTSVAPAGTPVALVMPVVAATPHADGSITHEVQYGQALWNISAVYKVSLPYLLALNGLNEDTLIYPGDKLLIRPADATDTPEASPTASTKEPPNPTRTPDKARSDATQLLPTDQVAGKHTEAAALAKAAPRSTDKPGEMAVSSAAGQMDAEIQDQPSGTLLDANEKGIDPLLLIIGGLVVVGTLLLLVGRWMQRGT